MNKIDKCVKKLIEKDISISFAESCTGGALASRLTKVSGVSKILSESFVTYSNESKVSLLKVKAETIDEFGVVSSEVAKEMARGLKDKTDSRLVVSVTGNAGPTLGDKSKELGEVYVSIILDSYEDSFKLQLKGTRKHIINKIVDIVFSEISDLID